ncbi:MAG: Maf family protein [Anaerolineaceae bacterium]|nr:Maf family protein [Anaerolineaceae bacterium]
MTHLRLRLASNSPRRREMLAWIGVHFTVQPASIDETPHPGEAPSAYVLRLAEGKVQQAARRPGQERLILAADTTVADGDQLLGKPESREDATAMLRQLRGRVHHVYTALAVQPRGQAETLTDLCVSEVRMRSYSDAEIEAYVASGDPFDKAGAYAIQNPDFHPVEGFEDCFANVMGLPLCHLYRTLRKASFSPVVEVAQTCQERLGYHCPVYRKFLVDAA